MVAMDFSQPVLRQVGMCLCMSLILLLFFKTELLGRRLKRVTGEKVKQSYWGEG